MLSREIPTTSKTDDRRYKQWVVEWNLTENQRSSRLCLLSLVPFQVMFGVDANSNGKK